MANKDLHVIASGGDGDGFAIGMGHTIHSIRRNIDITYVVMDNQIYGLTKVKRLRVQQRALKRSQLLVEQLNHPFSH